MGLEISQTSALIDIRTSPSRFDLHVSNPKLEIEQFEPKLDIETKLPQVVIDQTECFASAGLKSPLRFVAEQAKEGYATYLQYIEKCNQEGEAYGSIENKGNMIAAVARSNMYKDQKQYTIVSMPSVRPKIDFVGEQKITAYNENASGHYTDVKLIRGNVNANFTPSEVYIGMKRYNSINFEYVGKKFDKSV